MIVVEILVGIIVATVILTGICKIGAPLAEAFSERLRLKFQELGPEEERQLKARISSLEDEVLSLKQQVAGAQAASDYAVKLVEAQIAKTNFKDSSSDQSVIDLRMHQEKEKRAI
jgi:hypothetical protein